MENDYDLSINKYKEIEYIPVEYPPTREIIGNINTLQREIDEDMKKLASMLGEGE